MGGDKTTARSRMSKAEILLQIEKNKINGLM
jgi:hypothetical protein